MRGLEINSRELRLEMHDIVSGESAPPATLGDSREELGLDKEPARPESPTEAAILLLFSRQFELNDIGVTDSFFVLSGDSLSATTLMAAIERDFGVVLPVSALLEAETPRSLAAMVDKAIDGKSPTGCLVSIRPTGSDSPLFCVHAFTGDVAYARGLATAIGPTRPVYGLRALGLQAKEIPLPSVESIARRYVSEIRAVQPSGPYLLAGSCGGSFIAYEMAQQLCAEDEQVSGLILLDPPPNGAHCPWLASSLANASYYRVRAIVRLARTQIAARLGSKLTGEKRRGVVLKALEAAVALYRPLAYDGNVLLVHSEEFRDGLLDNERSLPSLVTRLRIAASGSRHLRLLDTHLAETGDILGRYLDEVASIDIQHP